jgi:hypothetical protein
MTMIRLASVRKKTTDLDRLTEDQWADINRLLMILWKTCPINCSVNGDIFEDRQCAVEPEESLSSHFLRASAL